MKQRIICKTLAIAVLLLFLGLTVQPALATVQNEKETDISEKIRTHIDRLKQLLDEYDEDICKLSMLVPEYKELFQELYDNIRTVNGFIHKIKPHDFPFLKWLYELILNLNFFFIVLPICLVLGILYAFFVIIPFMILLIIYVMSGPGPP
ncbi:hypothetical protein AYK21_01030 [Thermoplasmatales archaeon SG8-52-2]|nr:MAG: hypothetical protein AYK21_01030 [Thermoplasmatales archaeon SG8-52-2]